MHRLPLKSIFLSANPSPNVSRIWLVLSLLLSAAYSLPVLRQTLQPGYLVANDARQHLFWTRRFLEPGLFPQDLIADYFQSLAPPGYRAFYWSFAQLGLDPLAVARILPPILALLTTALAFHLSLRLFPIPFAAFLASSLYLQNLWMRDDLVSATPRAFLSPLLLTVLYAIAARRPGLMLLALLGLGGFYPPYLLVAAGVLFLLSLQGEFPWSWTGLGLGLIVLMLLPYLLQSSEFGPTVTLAQAQDLPEFQPGGRTAYFAEDWGRFWLWGGRTGLQPPLDPPLLCGALLLPVLLRRSPGPSANLGLLGALLLSGLGLFFLAHDLAFRLHLPSRYTQHSLRLVFALGAAIALVLLLQIIVDKSRVLCYATLGAILAYLLVYPTSLGNYPRTNLIVGNHAALYEFLQEQPRDIRIASLALEANQLPTFSRRSLYVGYEYAIPFHRTYHQEMRRRATALIQAHYSPDMGELTQFLTQEAIDFLVIERGAFEPDYLERSWWTRSYPDIAQTVEAQLYQGQIPALAAGETACTRFDDGLFRVVEANCLQSYVWERDSGSVSPGGSS
ncbi:MAG: hypothetical protein ACLFSH_00655 [Phormidium sp.]